MKKNQIVPVVRELKRLLKQFYSVSSADKCVLRTDKERSMVVVNYCLNEGDDK